MIEELKTIREWFQLLPEDIKQIAEYNSINCYISHQTETNEIMLDVSKHNCFRSALMAAFVFSKTEQGYDYWNKISYKYNKINN